MIRQRLVIDKWPASVLSSLVWVLAGFFILARTPGNFWPLIVGSMVSASVVAVGITATAWHSLRTQTTQVLDYAAVMFTMWVLVGTAGAAALHPFSFAFCVAVGTVAAVFVKEIPEELIIFSLAVLSVAALEGAAWYVLAFTGLVGVRALSHAHENRRVADLAHAVWHVGTAALIVIVSLKHLHSL